MKNKRIINSIYLLYKRNKLKNSQSSFDFLNYSSSRRKAKSYRRQDKLTRPSSSSSIFSQRLNFRNESKINILNNKDKDKDNQLNILDLMLENNPNKYNYQKLQNKINSIDNIYKNESNRSTYKVKEVFYKYNVLYGQNTSNLIRTYSPKMRPMSLSVNKFVKKMNNDQSDNLPVFSENEINELIKTKCSDIGIDVKDHMLLKFKDYCNTKCKNRTVDLAENFLGLNSIKFIANILYSGDRISKLNLSKNNLGDLGIEILINAIKDSYSLIKLNIASNGITYIGGEIVFKNLINQQSLIYFNISTIEGSNRNRNRLTFAGIKDIIPFLRNNHFIEYFNLSGNSIKNEGFISVCKGLNENKSLITLKLSQNEIGEKGIIHGLKYITSPINKLIYLDISKNRILDDGLIALTNQLKDFPNLLSLNLSFCGFEFPGFVLLLKSLQYNRKLEILNVSGNKLKDENFEQAKPYFSYIGLRSLNMSKCSLCDDSTFKLGECMENNFTIKKINISENEISDKGFRSFGALFYKNSVITHFDVSCNFLTNSGIVNFIKSLEVNNSLNNINLYDNQLHNDIGNLILQVLQKNRSLVYINLYYNRIPMKKIDEINKFIKINADNQKQKFVPNLIKSVRELEFNPNQFNILTAKIKGKKIERDSLYKKVKEEDNIYSSVMQEQQKDINIKMSEWTTISQQVRVLEEKMRNLDRIMAQEDKIYKEQEYKIKQRINREENNLSEAQSEKAIIQKDYNAIEMENKNILNLTQEKFNISERSFKKIYNSLSSINDNYNKKTEELHNLMSIKFSRNLRKRATSVKKSTIFSRKKSSVSVPNTLQTLKLNSPPSFAKKNEENKELSLFNIKENEEIKEVYENKSKKNMIKIKGKNHLDDKNKNMNEREKMKRYSKIKSESSPLFFQKK